MPQETYIDQMERSIKLENAPKRIISLVPSQTELLAYLGLDAEILGITKFCIYPDTWFRTKTSVGGTKQYHFDKIKALNPDLIIGNKEENDKTQIELLAAEYPVWMSDIKTLEDAYNMIQNIGKLTRTLPQAQALTSEIRTKFDDLKNTIKSPISAAYLIWRKPYMVAAKDTFIDEMLHLAGFTNVYNHQVRYPEIDLTALAKNPPQVLLLSSEPYPFKLSHIEEIQHLFPDTVIQLVDGTLFSWYGSRLLYSATYFQQLYTELSLKL